MNDEWVAVDITDNDDDGITETIYPEDWAAGERFARGCLFGLAAALTIWVTVGILIWAVWPR